MRCQRLILSGLLCLAAGCAAPDIVVQPGLVDGWYHVQRVVDGDTIILTNVGRMRLMTDAPEPGEPGGDEAKAALAARIEGRAVFVCYRRRKRDQMPARGGYGRLLGEIFSEPPVP